MASLNFNQGIQPDQKDKKSIKKEKICFIADFQIGEELKNILRSFAVPFCEVETNMDLVSNKSFNDLKELSVVWVNVTTTPARNWIATHLDSPANFALITVYKTKSEHNEWITQLQNIVDNVIFKSTLKNIKALSFSEIVDKMLAVYKLHKPKSTCNKIMKFLLRKFGI